MEIVLVRHAQPEWYVDDRYQDNPPLTDLGFAQAELVGEQLAREHWDLILCSPMLRARQTAAPLLEKLRRVEVVAPWLEEIREPEWSGRSREEIAGHYAGLETVPIEDRWTGLPGGESVVDFSDRVEHGLAEFLGQYGIVHHEHAVPSWTVTAGTPAEKADGPRVLMVAHGGTNGVVSARLLGAPRTPWPWIRIGYKHTTIGRFAARPTSGVLGFMLSGLETSHLMDDLITM
jgi:2,3-bisphosphoglycerate-dependent phosphoglycerate mutase